MVESMHLCSRTQRGSVDLPSALALTPTSHIENTQSMKIKLFQPVRTKKKAKSRIGKRGSNKKKCPPITIHPLQQNYSVPQKKSSDTIKIFNLSSYILSEAETAILSKGLAFCPSSRINEFDLFID